MTPEESKRERDRQAKEILKVVFPLLKQYRMDAIIGALSTIIHFCISQLTEPSQSIQREIAINWIKQKKGTQNEKQVNLQN